MSGGQLTRMLTRMKESGALDRERLIDEASESIWEAMKAEGMSRAELARRLKCSRANVTQMLGGSNLTLETLADVARALNHKAQVKLVSDTTTHFQILTDAFKQIGYDFVVRESQSRYKHKFVFLCNEKDRQQIENDDLDIVLLHHKFFEFDAEGNWSSY